MATAKRLSKSQAALKGIESHSGFLGEETLTRMVEQDAYENEVRKKYLNESLRVFRDAFLEFDKKYERISNSKADSQNKRRGLITEWMSRTLEYFGYTSANFDLSQLKLEEYEGHIVYQAPKHENHSVAVFVSASPESPISAFHSGHLTDPDGSVSYESHRKPSLIETVEKALKTSGLPEAVLFLPYGAYYLRSDSQTSNQCLELRWPEVMSGDNDEALILASHLLSADFFAYASQTSDQNSEKTDVEKDSKDEDSEEEGSAGSLNQRLTKSSHLFKEDLEQARRITEELHKQVTLALELLCNERLQIDPQLRSEAKKKTQNEKIANQLFKDGLFVLYRILFVLFAEAKAYLPTNNEKYAAFYSLEHLRDWAENFLRLHSRGQADPDGTYIWGTLLSIFTLLRRGVRLDGDQVVSPFNGQLFAPDQAPIFDQGPALRDSTMAKVLTALSRVEGHEHGRRLHFANLGVAQLGAVYESLLAQKPIIVAEEMTWVPAHGGGVGLVTVELAKALKMESFSEGDTGSLKKVQKQNAKTKRKAKGHLDSFISRSRPAYEPSLGKFIVAPLGGQKRQTASFYTPPKLAEFLVKRTLKPLVEGKSSQEILKLKIVEPAVGSGGFLIATLKYLGDQLLKAKVKERHPNLRGREPQPQDLQECKREILENCLFGVDVNPLSLELCRTSLYLEALVPGKPLPFLHHRLKCGNSLIGADFTNRSRASWDEGVEFPTLFDIPYQHIKVDKKIWAAWDNMQSAYGKVENSENLKEKQDQVVKNLRAEQNKIQDEWPILANGWQNSVSHFLQLSRKALEEFEKMQDAGDTVDRLDARHKDHLSLIPDMDPILIEATDTEVDEKLQRERRTALIREYGAKLYNRMVKHQRAFARLNALGDISTAMWFWPVDAWESFPTFSIFQELIEYLLNADGLDRTKRQKSLSKKALATLKTALKVANHHRFFHWNVEFSQVYANADYFGFSAIISNPPWKVVGVKDKDIYPHFDPTYNGTKASEKEKRVAALYKADPQAASTWYQQDTFFNHLSNLWQEGDRSEIRPSGKNDLATLFVLLAERISGTNGRYGLLVSRSAVFVNGGTKSLREHFFEKWGLEEASSFINLLDIFEIDSRVEFTCLVGTQSKRRWSSPRFVHGITDLNMLDGVAANLDVKDVSKISVGHRAVELDLKTVGNYFSKEILSIPGLTDPRQLEIAKALHTASGPVVYLDQIETSFIGQGINQKTGPQRGLSEFTESIPPKELPKWEDVLAGKIGKWVPLVKGKHYDFFRIRSDLSFSQYGNSQELRNFGIDLDSPVIVWRKISQPSNQRSLICATLPRGTFADDSSYTIQLDTDQDTLCSLLNAISTDFCMKFQGGTNRTFGQMIAMPLANYNTKFIDESSHLLTKKGIQFPKMDALLWLHYGQNKGALNRENLIWMLDTQFDCLKRNNPQYIKDVIEAFDHYSKQKNMYGVDPTPIFKLKSQPLTQSEPREPHSAALAKPLQKRKAGAKSSSSVRAS